MKYIVTLKLPVNATDELDGIESVCSTLAKWLKEKHLCRQGEITGWLKANAEIHIEQKD